MTPLDDASILAPVCGDSMWVLEYKNALAPIFSPESAPVTSRLKARFGNVRIRRLLNVL